MTTQSESKIPLGTITNAVKDILSVRRVFGEAYERDGVTVIPVAKIWGGSGEGQAFGNMGGEGKARFGKPATDAADGGTEPGMSGSGEALGGGGGFGVLARPAGVYVMDGKDVYWQPAISVNQLACVAGAVAAVGLAALPCLVRAFRRHR